MLTSQVELPVSTAAQAAHFYGDVLGLPTRTGGGVVEVEVGLSVLAAAPSAQTLDASRHADPDQVLRAVDAKAMSFLRLANAALPIMARAGYGDPSGVPLHGLTQAR
jgi:catechol 2,3-dioxygenase-like lactoylglutathione lyase family enzyme